jgi:hypothetical protein
MNLRVAIGVSGGNCFRAEKCDMRATIDVRRSISVSKMKALDTFDFAGIHLILKSYFRILIFWKEESSGGQKKGKPSITPLQPPTLATFRSWGSSAGASRAGLPGGKDSWQLVISN